MSDSKYMSMLSSNEVELLIHSLKKTDADVSTLREEIKELRVEIKSLNFFKAKVIGVLTLITVGINIAVQIIWR
jgi:hypothetical protein